MTIQNVQWRDVVCSAGFSAQGLLDVRTWCLSQPRAYLEHESIRQPHQPQAPPRLSRWFLPRYVHRSESSRASLTRWIRCGPVQRKLMTLSCSQVASLVEMVFAYPRTGNSNACAAKTGPTQWDTAGHFIHIARSYNAA